MMMMMMMKTNDKQIGTSFYVCLFHQFMGQNFSRNFKNFFSWIPKNWDRFFLLDWVIVRWQYLCVVHRVCSPVQKWRSPKFFFHEFFISFNFLVFFLFVFLWIDLPVIVNMGQIHFSNQNNNVFCLWFFFCSDIIENKV